MNNYIYRVMNIGNIDCRVTCDSAVLNEFTQGAFHLVRTQFYMLSGPPPPFCMFYAMEMYRRLDPPPLSRTKPFYLKWCVRTKWNSPKQKIDNADIRLNLGIDCSTNHTCYDMIYLL